MRIATLTMIGAATIGLAACDKGGLDTGLFGYGGTVVHKATALQLVTPYTP